MSKVDKMVTYTKWMNDALSILQLIKLNSHFDDLCKKFYV